MWIHRWCLFFFLKKHFCCEITIMEVLRWNIHSMVSVVLLLLSLSKLMCLYVILGKVRREVCLLFAQCLMLLFSMFCEVLMWMLICLLRKEGRRWAFVFICCFVLRSFSFFCSLGCCFLSLLNGFVAVQYYADSFNKIVELLKKRVTS